MVQRVILLMMIGMMLMACGTPSTSWNQGMGTGTWQLTQLGTASVTDSVTIQLQDNGSGAYTINGQGFCNSYNAPITVNGTTLTIANVASTRRMCPDPQMQNERDYFAALQATTQIVVESGKLQFRDASGNVLLTFTQ